jgi:hypothetical protein
VVLPAPAQCLFVELRLQEDGTSFAFRVVRNVRRKDRASAHAAVAKLFHIMWINWELGAAGSLMKFGGSVWIGSAGLLGAFLAIAFLGFGAVYLFVR